MTTTSRSDATRGVSTPGKANENAELSLARDGERFTPGIMTGEVALEHWHRYLFALQFVSGKDVLDIASGEGYGSFLLSQRARSVTGVDISSQACEHAAAKYKADDLIYKVGSCSEIPMASHSVDVVVSFETIEHIVEHDEMLTEVSRVLRPAGVLILSSPNKLEYTDKTGSTNPFHLKELYLDEFQALLGRHFCNVQLAGQRVLAGSVIEAEHAAGRPLLFNVDAPTQQHVGLVKPMYFIALASQGDLPVFAGSVLEQDIRALINDITYRDPAVTAVIREIAGRDNVLLRDALTSEWYLQRNFDLALAGVDPVAHWFSHGADEGRLPAPRPAQLIASIAESRVRNLSIELQQELAKQVDTAAGLPPPDKDLVITETARSRLRLRFEWDRRLGKQTAALRDLALRLDSTVSEYTRLRGALDRVDLELRQHLAGARDCQLATHTALTSLKDEARADAVRLMDELQVQSRELRALLAATAEAQRSEREQTLAREDRMQASLDRMGEAWVQLQDHGTALQARLESAINEVRQAAKDEAGAVLQQLDHREQLLSQKLRALDESLRGDRDVAEQREASLGRALDGISDALKLSEAGLAEAAALQRSEISRLHQTMQTETQSRQRELAEHKRVLEQQFGNALATLGVELRAEANSDSQQLLQRVGDLKTEVGRQLESIRQAAIAESERAQVDGQALHESVDVAQRELALSLNELGQLQHQHVAALTELRAAANADKSSLLSALQDQSETAKRQLDVVAAKLGTENEELIARNEALRSSVQRLEIELNDERITSQAQHEMHRASMAEWRTSTQADQEALRSALNTVEASLFSDLRMERLRVNEAHDALQSGWQESSRAMAAELSELRSAWPMRLAKVLTPARPSPKARSAPAPTPVAQRSIDDIVHYDGSEFIHLTYAVLLGRPPDEAGLSHYLRRLTEGANKESIIFDIATSAEGQTTRRQIPGLEALLRRGRLRRWALRKTRNH